MVIFVRTLQPDNKMTHLHTELQTSATSSVYFQRLPSTPHTTLRAYCLRLLPSTSTTNASLNASLVLSTPLLSSHVHSILDLLSKLSHDADVSTSQSAILALGLVSAGTNNSRCAGILRQLSVFYGKDRYVITFTYKFTFTFHVNVFVSVCCIFKWQCGCCWVSKGSWGRAGACFSSNLNRSSLFFSHLLSSFPLFSPLLSSSPPFPFPSPPLPV